MVVAKGDEGRGLKGLENSTVEEYNFALSKGGDYTLV